MPAAELRFLEATGFTRSSTTLYMRNVAFQRAPQPIRIAIAVSKIAHRIRLRSGYSRHMSERSIYLRDQIAKCEFHAKNIGDFETEGKLRQLAAQYLAEALEIERIERRR